MLNDIDFKYIKTNGIELHVAISRPEDGDLVILLHGFPEFWFSWRKQIGALAAEGYRVVVPDQRGYNKSWKPRGRRAFEINQLQKDVIGLIGHFGREAAAIIGHDWGGAVAWHLAGTHPHMVRCMVIINMPHPSIFPKVMLKRPLQWLRSSYILFYQLPKVPEKILSSSNFRMMEKALQYTSRRGTFTQDELTAYKSSWGEPKALESMLNWYRAVPASWKEIVKNMRINVPSKIIWGTGDQFLSKQLAEESLKFIDSESIIWVEDATHWVHQEQPEFVNARLIQFLDQTGPDDG